MTDNEIIKLLECCKKSQCSKCYYSKECDGYTQVNYALDLINRQQAEIQRITEKFNCQQTVYADLSKIIKNQKEEIVRLEYENEILSKNADTAFQDGLNEAQDLYAEQIKDEIKSEAIKECAERLKEKVENVRKKYQRLCREQDEKEDEIIEIHCKGIIKLINNLVKEYEKGK